MPKLYQYNCCITAQPCIESEWNYGQLHTNIGEIFGDPTTSKDVVLTTVNLTSVVLKCLFSHII